MLHPVPIVVGVTSASVLLGVGIAAGTESTSAPSPVRAESPRVSMQVIARSTLADTRATLVAVREGRYQATMRLRVATKRKGDWKVLDTARVGKKSGYFWYVVTRREGVCAFSLGERPRAVKVRLSYSPSVGCDKTRTFRIRKGELVRT